MKVLNENNDMIFFSVFCLLGIILSNLYEGNFLVFWMRELRFSYYLVWVSYGVNEL